MAEFNAALRKAESYHNAGCTTDYQAVRNKTIWYVAGRVFGESAGPLGTRTQYWINEEN
jgi:hypothetical protein